MFSVIPLIKVLEKTWLSCERPHNMKGQVMNSKQIHSSLHDYHACWKQNVTWMILINYCCCLVESRTVQLLALWALLFIYPFFKKLWFKGLSMASLFICCRTQININPVSRKYLWLSQASWNVCSVLNHLYQLLMKTWVSLFNYSSSLG